MGLYTIKYTLPAGAVPDYELEILRGGSCPALLPGSCFEGEGKLYLRFDCEGCRSLRWELASLEGREPPGLLAARLRACAEALREAEDWLIPPEDLSLGLDEVRFDGKGRARILLRPRGRTPFEHMLSLCSEVSREAPGFNADLIGRRLSTAAEEGASGCRELLRVLSALGMETAGSFGKK